MTGGSPDTILKYNVEHYQGYETRILNAEYSFTHKHRRRRRIAIGKG
jgi:hypothetical protein